MSAAPGEDAPWHDRPTHHQAPPQYPAQSPYPMQPQNYLPQGIPAQQGYPNGYWQPGPYQQVQQQRPTDGLAIAALVLGIVWVFFIGSILAVIFGHISLGRIAREGKAGRGMAIAGLVLGYIGVAWLAILIIVGIVNAAMHN